MVMPEAQFRKGQPVYVKPVGTWALIEHVVPHWAKGIEEPIRVHYDVGLGREFSAEELLNEEPMGGNGQGGDGEHWRAARGPKYTLTPAKVEEQARLIASAPQLAAFADGLIEWARKSGEDMPNALVELAHSAQDLLAHVKGQ